MGYREMALDAGARNEDEIRQFAEEAERQERRHLEEVELERLQEEAMQQALAESEAEK